MTMTTKGFVKDPKNVSKEELDRALSTPYDITKPFKKVVTGESSVIVQNGEVYEEGSGKHLGSTKTILTPSKGVLMVPETGATFPDTPRGKIMMEKYKDRNGISTKPKTDSKVAVKESTVEERKAAVQENKAK